jgi:opacity protein-like surface antigen
VRTLRCWAAALFVFTLLPPAVVAQDLAGRGAFTPQAGVVIPSGDFARDEMPDDAENIVAGYGETSFTLGATLEYFFSNRISLGGTFCYNRFGINMRIFEQYSPGQDSEGHYSVMEFCVFARLTLLPQSRWRPYARAGMLFGRLRGEGTINMFDPNIGITLDKDLEFDTDMGIGGEFGVGVLHMISSTNALFGEVSYTLLQTEGKRMNLAIPGIVAGYADLGFDAEWFGVRFGLSYFFGE